MEPKIDVEPDAWATKDMCVGPNFGKIRYDKLPIQSMNPLQYTHEKLYSEKTVIGLMKAAYYNGLTSFQCIGVIDYEGYIYPEPPEAGTQVFVETPNAELTGRASAACEGPR